MIAKPEFSEVRKAAGARANRADRLEGYLEDVIRLLESHTNSSNPAIVRSMIERCQLARWNVNQIYRAYDRKSGAEHPEAEDYRLLDSEEAKVADANASLDAAMDLVDKLQGDVVLE